MGSVVDEMAVEERYIFKDKILSVGVLPKAKYIRGLQASLVADAKNVRGVQAAGVFAGVENDVYGVQAAGLDAFAENVRGVQAAGLVALAENDVYGAQVGLVAVSENDVVYGAQVGLVALAENVRGVQAGFLAVSENVRGVQLAPLSVISDGENSDAVQLGLLLWGPGNKSWNPSVFYQRVKGKKEVRHLGTLEKIVKSIFRGL